MICPLYDYVRASINYRMINDSNIGRSMTLEDAIGAVEGVQSKKRILKLTSKLLLEIDRHRQL